jgi:hypothetical protein
VSKQIHEAAFALVDPSRNSCLRSWKDQIAAVVTDRELEAAGVTIEQVNDAIEFFTATTALTTREKIGTGAEPGYLILADGYRAGPAGDH